MSNKTFDQLYEEKESNEGVVLSVSGPVVIAEKMRGAAMYELVRVGQDQLVGEIIRLEGDTATIQTYEETSGLTVGDVVQRTGQPLSVALGPGIMGSIFDGIQRPLQSIADAAVDAVYIPRGVNVPALDMNKKWHFVPYPGTHEGDKLTGGDIFGLVQENQLIEHRIMVPPGKMGEVVFLAQEGEYTLQDVVMELRPIDGRGNQTHKLTMMHMWPVRQPRPVIEKASGDHPLLTGQRVLDAMFPAVQGGTCAIPGAFGCGKTVISQSISKYSNSDVIIYVGCGERGNEMAEVLMDFPQLTVTDKKTGQEVSVMNRTSLVANTSNMPVAAREASIYTGITLSEYFRDMGYNVSMMADSSSRWAEALREISGRLAEMPADSGYPAYLGARLASFYERAGKVRCLGNPGRIGSVTIVGAVSPPGGDFCFGRGTKVLMYDGSIKAIESVVVGDKLMGDDNAPRAVQALSQGTADLYKVNPSDRSACDGFVCTGNHILVLEMTGTWPPRVLLNKEEELVYFNYFYLKDSKPYHGTKTFSFKNGSPHLDETRARAAAHVYLQSLPESVQFESTLAEFLALPDSIKKHCKLVRSGAVCFANEHEGFFKSAVRNVFGAQVAANAKVMPLLAWFVGLWLGDGDRDAMRITVHKDEVEELSKIVELASALEMQVSRSPFQHSPDTLRVSIFSGLRGPTGGNANKLIDLFRELGIWDNKHIPLGLIRDDIDTVRLPLMAGLIDSDGYLDKRGVFCFSQKDRVFAEQFQLLARTCGFKASLNEAKTTAEPGGPAFLSHMVAIGGRIEQIPTVIPRKQFDRATEPNKDIRRIGFKIEKIEAGEFFGVLVDGNKRFLLADMMITHNSDPVTAATLGIVQVFWGLDKKLAQRKHFPSVNWLISYSNYVKNLAKYYDQVDSEFIHFRKVIGRILQQEEDLSEIVQLVGKDSLAETDKVVLETAKLLRENFLAQNAYSSYDKYCPFYKTVWMMRNFVHFYEESIKAVSEQGSSGTKVTWASIRRHLGDLLYKLAAMKFADPAEGQEKLVKQYQEFYDEISSALRNLSED